MTGDCHVRFCESLGLQRPGPLTKTLSRAQKLAKALKACKRDKNKAKRAACVRTAHKRYGPAKRAAKKKKKK